MGLTEDNKLISQLENKISNIPAFWDFRDNYEKSHIHGILTYPATMIPKMQSELLSIILSIDKTINNIFDPFMGSGTVLVEGMIQKLDIFGMDINPLAYLVSLVKTTPLDTDLLLKKSELLFDRITTTTDFTITSFPNINKWFKDQIIFELSKIRAAIIKEPDIKYRRFFWVPFCEIIRISCNSQKSTFKLHIKNEKDVASFNYDSITAFKKNVIQSIQRMSEYTNILKSKPLYKTDISKNKQEKKVLYGNSAELLDNKNLFKDNSIDLISTSPPYGDNHTTVTYGQYSVLQLRWIELKDITPNIDIRVIQTQSQIDYNSLGGRYYSLKHIDDSGILDISPSLNHVYNLLISEGEKQKARKVASFYIDFFKILKNISRVLKPEKYSVFTIGNRRVNNHLIKFNDILIELCLPLNLNLIYDFRRNILMKRVPSLISNTKLNEPVKSIREENILIFKKKG